MERMILLFICIACVGALLFGIGVGFVNSNKESNASTNTTAGNNGIELVYLNVNGTNVPCAFYNWGSYGGAALSCDWNVMDK